jgi:shikimate dehydrogenase
VKFAIVGDPVEHSRSPAIHNAAFTSLDIDADFGFMLVGKTNFGEVVDALRTGALDGVSVTMPHKHNAYTAADELSDAASRTGAVNTLVVVDDRLVGYNTDVTGVQHALRTVETDHDHPILILGYGGAAAAALLAVEGRTVYISGRVEDRAASLAERVDVAAEVVPWTTPVAMATVINATPLGMAGENLPDGIVERAGAVADMTYGTQRSPAVAHAVALGLPTADGLTMLVGQAFKAFELFTGRKAPEMTMEQAARQAG